MQPRKPKDVLAEHAALVAALKPPQMLVDYDSVVRIIEQADCEYVGKDQVILFLYEQLAELDVFVTEPDKPALSQKNPYGLDCACRRPEVRQRTRSRRDPFDDQIYFRCENCHRRSQAQDSLKEAQESWDCFIKHEKERGALI